MNARNNEKESKMKKKKNKAFCHYFEKFMMEIFFQTK